MITKHVCKKCGQVLGQIETTGGGFDLMGDIDLGLCPRCGGIVVEVSGDPPPQISRRGPSPGSLDPQLLASRLGAVGLATALLWVIASALLCLVAINAPRPATPDPAAQESLNKLVITLMWHLALINGPAGLIVGLLSGMMTVRALQQDEIDVRAGRVSAGSAAGLAQTLLLSIIVSALGCSFGMPRVVPEGLVLRGIWALALLGAGMGLIIGLSSYRAIVKAARVSV